MRTRYETGRTVQDQDEPDIFYQTVAEALKWDNEDEVVQLVKITTFVVEPPQMWKKPTIGYQVSEMRISGNNPHLRLTTTNVEEAVQMYLSIAFGM